MPAAGCCHLVFRETDDIASQLNHSSSSLIRFQNTFEHICDVGRHTLTKFENAIAMQFAVSFCPIPFHSIESYESDTGLEHNRHEHVSD